MGKISPYAMRKHVFGERSRAPSPQGQGPGQGLGLGLGLGDGEGLGLSSAAEQGLGPGQAPGTTIAVVEPVQGQGQGRRGPPMAVMAAAGSMFKSLTGETIDKSRRGKEGGIEGVLSLYSPPHLTTLPLSSLRKSQQIPQ